MAATSSSAVSSSSSASSRAHHSSSNSFLISSYQRTWRQRPHYHLLTSLLELRLVPCKCPPPSLRQGPPNSHRHVVMTSWRRHQREWSFGIYFRSVFFNWTWINSACIITSRVDEIRHVQLHFSHFDVKLFVMYLRYLWMILLWQFSRSFFFQRFSLIPILLKFVHMF